MSKVISMRRGQAVKSFPLRASNEGGFTVGAKLTGLLDAYRGLVDLPDESQAKLEAISADKNLTLLGQKNQVREWFAGRAAPAVRKAREAMAKAEADILAIRATMIGGGIDKTDVAGAMLRSELRSWLRDMPPERRTGLLHAGELPPEAVLAIVEAPAALSGFTPQQRERLASGASDALHPEQAKEIAELEEGILAVASAERAVSQTAQRDAGLVAHEMNDLVGLKHSERIKEIMRHGELGDLPADEPAPAA